MAGFGSDFNAGGSPATVNAASGEARARGRTPQVAPYDYISIVQADSPVVFWPLNETSGTVIHDASGNNRDAVYQHSPALAQSIRGLPGNIGVTWNTSPGTGGTGGGYWANPNLTVKGTFTIEFWTYNPAAGSSGGGNGFCGARYSGEDYTFDIQNYYSSSPYEGLHGDFGTGLTWLSTSSYPFTFATGKAYHVVAVVDATSLTYYVNGVQQTQYTWASNTPLAFDPHHPLNIAGNGNYNASPNDLAQAFQGTLSAFAFYDYALTSSQITNHYNAVTSSSVSPPAAQGRARASAVAVGSATITPRAATAKTVASGVAPVCSATITPRAATAKTVASGVAPALGSYSDTVLADGPMGYWRLNETSGTTAADQENASPGTYLSGMTLGQPALAPGLSDSASFPGSSSSYVNVPSTSALSVVNGTHTLTAEVWASMTTLSTNVFFLEKNTDYYLWWDPTNGLLYFGWYNGSYHDHTAAWTPSTNTTYHIVATADGTNVRFYINGSLLATVAQNSTSFVYSSNALALGASNGGTSGDLNGLMSDVALYDYALTASQVQNHYSIGGATGLTPSSASARSAAPAPSASAGSSGVSAPSASARGTANVPEISVSASVQAVSASVRAEATGVIPEIGILIAPESASIKAFSGTPSLVRNAVLSPTSASARAAEATPTVFAGNLITVNATSAAATARPQGPTTEFTVSFTPVGAGVRVGKTYTTISGGSTIQVTTVSARALVLSNTAYVTGKTAKTATVGFIPIA